MILHDVGQTEARASTVFDCHGPFYLGYTGSMYNQFKDYLILIYF